MLHLMNFYSFITFLKLFLLGHAKTSRTQHHFTCRGMRADRYTTLHDTEYNLASWFLKVDDLKTS